MQQEFFNPDILDENTPYAEDHEQVEVESTPPKKRKGTSKDDAEKLKQRVEKKKKTSRVSMIAGIIIGFLGLFLTVAFISFLSDGAADQSAVLNNSAEELAKASEISIKNIAGALGAKCSEWFINRWVGFGAFAFSLWLLAMGVRCLGVKKIKFYVPTLTMLIMVALVSLIGGYVSLHNVSAVNYGGNLGLEVSKFLVGYVGDLGTVMIYAVLVFILVVIYLNAIVSAYAKAKALIPKKPVKEEKPEEEPKEKEKSLTDKERSAIEFELADSDIKEESSDSVTNSDSDSHATSEPVTEPETDVKEVDSEDDLLKRYGPKEEQKKESSQDVEPQSSITVADPVEKANVILEPIDPTDDLPHFKLPPLDLLKNRPMKTNNVDFDEQEANKRKITEVLSHYDIKINSIDACVGPTVTLFEIVPADGVKIAKIKNLEDDIAMSIAALGIRIIAPIPGRGTIGIEVPNREPQIVSMRAVLESKAYQESTAELPMAIGCTISNKVFVEDLCKMPHLLVAGATGQGKSVGLNAIITSLLYRKHPAELKFVLFDPKVVEFSLYEKLQHHYLAKLPGDDPIIITDSNKAIATLNSLVALMEQRYQLLKDANVRNIKEYNKKYTKRFLNPEKGHHFMPYIVVVIDEFADFISVAGKEVETPIARIAQKARAVGIHMIIATQRPSADVITGKIKANFPGRISFKVSSMVDSRTVIDCSGAQRLVGKGDLLFVASTGDLVRVQCAFMDDDETIKLCEYIDSQVGYATPFELPEYIAPSDGADFGGGGSGSVVDRDPLLEEVAAYISGMDKASTSAIQRHFRIGYNRAGSIMDQLENLGIVGPASGGKPRQVLVDASQIQQML